MMSFQAGIFHFNGSPALSDWHPASIVTMTE